MNLGQQHIAASGERMVARLLVGCAAIALAVYFVVLIAPFMNMFLLDEYRQWIFNIDLFHLYEYFQPSHFFDLSGTSAYTTLMTSRSLSYWTSMAFGEMCGSNPTCHNGLHLTLLLVATACAVLTVRRLSTSGTWVPLLLTAAVILISVPMLDAIAWQATILDKLAMLFTSVGLLVAASVDVERPRLRSLVFANLCLGVIVLAAYNSKEAAFFLVPALVTLIACRALSGNVAFLRATGRALLYTAVPTAYAILHIGMVYYNRRFVNPGEYMRVTGGDIASNTEFYARYLLDLYGSDTSRSTVLAVVAVLAATVLAASLMSLGRNRRTVPLPIWALIALLGSLVISIRTTIPAPFYLLVPLLYLGVLLGVTADAILTSLPTSTTRVAFAIACLLFLGIRANTVRAFLPWLDRLAVLSTNFQKTLPAIRSAIAADPAKRILLIATSDDVRSFLLVGRGGANNALSSFLLDDAKATASQRLHLDQSVVFVPATTKQPAVQPGDLRAFLGPDLQLDHIERTPGTGDAKP